MGEMLSLQMYFQGGAHGIYKWMGAETERSGGRPPGLRHWQDEGYLY